MGAVASQITSLTIVYQTVYSGSDQRKHQSSTSLALVREIHRWQVNPEWSMAQRPAVAPVKGILDCFPVCMFPSSDQPYILS